MKDIKEIIKILESPCYQGETNLKVSYSEDLANGKVGLNRIIEIVSENGEEFNIKWYCNISYFNYNNATIPFTDIEISNNWPNGSLLNIQLKYNKETSFILPIRNYK